MRPAAVLVDVYETALTCDFDEHRRLLPARAGVDEVEWDVAFQALGDLVTDGRLTMFDAYAEIVARCGRTPDAGLIGDLVALDRALLRKGVHVFNDTVPALRALRADGLRTAFLSNCAENTRPLLEELQLLELVDHVVLSNEIGAAKPDRRIYQHALDLLDLAPERVVLIDDQVGFCRGAEEVGISALQIARFAAQPTHGNAVTSLSDAHERIAAMG
ncbi:MAG: HAD-IA family hydrolase [Actinomycetota bacterium]